ncbi:hypothetical protein [Paraburkholderia pallida]|uniref:Uncharacterized protein n=1 Tax=Paraburkholderia pallida TaxID=2547399 RepID=A0A4P7CQP5_9BURK|nr:hypothetical protein [Paraburkholderia pallida]QBQ96289.1 hypothetical protein E1956_03285 [Paraburkholderia pallida]
MSNSTTQLDQISATQAFKEAVANALFDAASPGMIWGRHDSTTSLLTWGYYGGYYGNSAVANGTLTLAPSATNYIFADPTTGAVSVNTTGIPSGKIPLYQVVTNATTTTSWTDLRSYAPISQLSTAGTQPANEVYAGPSSGAAAAPGFRALVPADLPVMGASGGGHASGAAPDPGATAGSTRYLREDATWAVPSGGGSSPPVLPVNAQTGTSYTLAATDAPSANGYQGIVTMNNAGANTLTVPPNSSVSFPVGTQIQVVQLGAGQTTVSGGSGVTVNNPSSLTARAQYSSLVLTQIAANTWILGGDMT